MLTVPQVPNPGANLLRVPKKLWISDLLTLSAFIRHHHHHHYHHHHSPPPPPPLSSSSSFIIFSCVLSSRFLPPAFFRATHSSSSGFLAPSLPTCKPHGCLHTCPAEGSAGWTPVSGCIFLSWRDAPAKLAGLFRFHPVYGIIGTASSF